MAMHSTSSSIVTVLTRAAAAVCTAAMCISLAACGENAEGVYEYSANGMTMTLELKEDKFTMKMTANEETKDLGTGTYKVDGDKITLTMGSTSITGTLKDGKITIAMEGEGSTEITYTKK